MVETRTVPLVDNTGAPFRVRIAGLAPDRLDALLARHVRVGERFDPDSYPPALVHACLIDPPGVRRSEVAAWHRTWPADQWGALFAACQAASGETSDWPGQLARIRADVLFGLELDVCASMGMPHSVFLTWSRVDRDKAIARYVATRDVCPGGCGVPREGMGNPEAADYEEVACVHCENREAWQKANRERIERGGAFLTVIPRPVGVNR